LGVNTVMGFGHLAAALEDQRLRGVKRREVSGSTRRFGKLDTGNRTSLVQRLARLFEVALGLRFQKSMPSRRI
jgi:hypothetical protein